MSFSPLFYIYYPADGISVTGCLSAWLNQDMNLIWQTLIYNTQIAIDLCPVADGSSPSFCSFESSPDIALSKVPYGPVKRFSAGLASDR